MKIKEFLQNNGLKLRWLADELGMGENLLRYFLGRKLSPELKTKIATVLKNHGYTVVDYSSSLLEEFNDLAKTSNDEE